MLEKNRAVYAKACRELEAEGYFDELAKKLRRKPKTARRAITAKKQVGKKKITAEKPKRRIAAKRVKISAGK